jgi:hypothetical protein
MPCLIMRTSTHWEISQPRRTLGLKSESFGRETAKIREEQALSMVDRAGSGPAAFAPLDERFSGMDGICPCLGQVPPGPLRTLSQSLSVLPAKPVHDWWLCFSFRRGLIDSSVQGNLLIATLLQRESMVGRLSLTARQSLEAT